MLHKKTQENVLKIFWYSLPINSVVHDYNSSCTKLRWVLIIFFSRTWIPLDSEPVSRNYTGRDMTPCPSVMPCSQVCNTTEFSYEVFFSKWKKKRYLLPDSSGNTLEMPQTNNIMQVDGFASHGGDKGVHLLTKKILEVLSRCNFPLPLEEFHRLIKSFLQG